MLFEIGVIGWYLFGTFLHWNRLLSPSCLLKAAGGCGGGNLFAGSLSSGAVLQLELLFASANRLRGLEAAVLPNAYFFKATPTHITIDTYSMGTYLNTTWTSTIRSSMFVLPCPFSQCRSMLCMQEQLSPFFRGSLCLAFVHLGAQKVLATRWGEAEAQPNPGGPPAGRRCKSSLGWSHDNSIEQLTRWSRCAFQQYSWRSWNPKMNHCFTASGNFWVGAWILNLPVSGHATTRAIWP